MFTLANLWFFGSSFPFRGGLPALGGVAMLTALLWRDLKPVLRGSKLSSIARASDRSKNVKY